MSEAKLLRALADKIEALDAVRLFPAEVVDPGSLTVSWSEGSDHEGYQGLSEAISALVKQHWAALRSQVVKQGETDVQAAREAWSGHDQKRPAATVVSAAASMGLESAPSPATEPAPRAAAVPTPRAAAEPALRRAS